MSSTWSGVDGPGDAGFHSQTTTVAWRAVTTLRFISSRPLPPSLPSRLRAFSQSAICLPTLASFSTATTRSRGSASCTCCRTREIQVRSAQEWRHRSLVRVADIHTIILDTSRSAACWAMCGPGEQSSRVKRQRPSTRLRYMGGPSSTRVVNPSGSQDAAHPAPKESNRMAKRVQDTGSRLA